jgi:hypothetical protein
MNETAAEAKVPLHMKMKSRPGQRFIRYYDVNEQTNFWKRFQAYVTHDDVKQQNMYCMKMLYVMFYYGFLKPGVSIRICY